MLKLKNILSELLNTYSVNAEILTDTEYNITDVLDQIRAVRKITIVRNITTDKPEEDMAKIKEDILTSDMSATDLRVPGVKSFKFRDDTLRRI